MNKRKFLNRKNGICLLAAAVFLTAAKPIPAARADENNFVTWSEVTGKANEVNVALCLQGQEQIADITTFQVGFHLEGEDILDAEFLFGSGIKGEKEIPVHEYRYDDESGDLTVYVSGRKTVLNRKMLELGKIRVDSEKNVVVSINKDDCIAVNSFHGQKQIEEMGDVEEYTMKIEKTKPTEPADPSEPENPSEPTDPSEPENPSGPADPSKPENPSEPTKPSEPTDPSKPSEPSKPTNPSRPGSSGSGGSSSSGSAVSARETKGSWQKNGEVWTFKKLDGTYVSSEWALVQGKWYWFDEKGQMKTGWVSVGGLWYYLSPSGEMKTGWIQDQGKWYYLAASGHMKTGWIEDKSCWYYMEPDGSMKTGWREVNGKWYYFDQTGKMLAESGTPDGHYVDRNGVRIR